MSTLLVEGGHVLTDDGAALRRADVLVRDGAIVAVDVSPLTPPGCERLDAAGGLVIPGLVNGHTHGHGALARGAVPDRIALEGFLAHGSALLGQRTLADLQLSTTLSAVELLRRGCTACIDMAAQLPAPTVAGLLAIGQAYADAGLRAVVAPMVSDRTLYEAYPALAAALPPELQAQLAVLRPPPAEALLDVLREAQRAWPFDRERVQLGVGPAIPLHCSDALLAGCGELSAQFGVPLQTHLLESKLQALAQDPGESTVQRLQRLGCLTPRTSLAHGVWLDADDMARIAAAGATVVHNPMSNLRLGSGVAPLRALLRAGVQVAIGSDASNTSDGQNLFESARLAAYLSRLGAPDWDDWIDAQEAFALATRGAARAFGLEGRMGRIAAGQAADLVVLDLGQPHFTPLRHPVRQLVFGENGSGVRAIVVDGRVRVAQGRIPGIDEAALRVRAQDRAAALDLACTPAASLATAAMPALRAFCCGGQLAPLGLHRQGFRPDTPADFP